MEIFHEDFSLIGEIEVFVFESFEFFVHVDIFLLIKLLVFFDDLLSFFDFEFELFNFSEFVSFDFGDDSFVAAGCAILQEEGVDFPDVFDELFVALADLFE